MDNPKTRAILGTQDTGCSQSLKNNNTKTEKDEHHEPHQKTKGESRCSRRV